MVKEKLKLYASDPENPALNYLLGIDYYTQRNYASSLNFFLRCAELTDDDLLAYQSLILCSNCLYRQGNRQHSKTGFILHALSINNFRPEAWFLLLRHCEENKQWQECYTYSSIALRTCQFNLANIPHSDYPGKWAIEFIMAKSAYQIGRSEESRRILRQIVISHWKSMDPNYRMWVLDEIKKLGDREIINRPSISGQKTIGFPKVRYTSLSESVERRNLLNDRLQKYKIQAEPFIVERMKEGEFKIVGDLVSNVPLGNIAATITNLRLIDDWYKNTNEPYLVVFEDDVMLETIDLWNFEWMEFFNELPDDWEAVQLCLISETNREIKFTKRNLHDWGGQAYLIKREYAKKLIDSHIKEDHFLFEIPGNKYLNPVAEHILFDGKGIVYNFPLFVENSVKLPSTNNDNDNNLISHFRVLEWWKSNKKSVKELINC